MSNAPATALQLAASVTLCFLPGVIGSRFGPGTWYQELVKPPLTPPGWVFPVVWTVLYAMMGVALFLAWRAGSGQQLVTAMLLFGGQLVLNGLWSWLFFGLQRPGLAAVDIVLLLILIALSAAAFWRLSTLAALLLLPYLAWVGFATYLNLALWALNRS